jgi:drug/metabolite transporter (DMT)-like permease
MDGLGIKKLFYFSLAVLFSIVLVWIGSKFLFFNSDHLSSTWYFILGLLIILGGILFVSSPDFRNYWWIGAILILIGIYLFARASDAISQPWLARILGAASWLAAAILLYITWPIRKASSKTGSKDDGPEA